jgi:glycolate oxidase FAD binding subunit
MRSDAEPEAILAASQRLGGHVSLWRGEVAAEPHASSLTPVLRQLHTRLKQAFDPAGILNPGIFPGSG